jgi:hypothetical protein
MKRLIELMALVFAMAGISAGPHKDYAKIEDSSFTEGNGDRVIQLSVDLAATTNEVWRTFTTDAGWKSFGVAFASVDLQVGGIIETSYNPKAQGGEPDNIKNQIAAYVPGKILAFRCVQAPGNFQHKEQFYATSTVLEIVPLSPKETRVVLTAVGYKPGAAYNDLFEKFRWGNAYTLEKLRLRFEEEKSSAPNK